MVCKLITYATVVINLWITFVFSVVAMLLYIVTNVINALYIATSESADWLLGEIIASD